MAGFSYDYGSVHVTSLSTEHPYTVGTPQYEWIANDLVGPYHTGSPDNIYLVHPVGVRLSQVGVMSIASSFLFPPPPALRSSLLQVAPFACACVQAAAVANRANVPWIIVTGRLPP